MVKAVELKVEAVALDWKGAPVVVLREMKGERAVFIWINLLEASSISIPLEKQSPPRPLTHDLIVRILEQLQARVDRIIISDVLGATYYAQLELLMEGDRRCSIDCRPSDGIAVALRTNAPLFIDSDLLDRLESLRAEPGAEISSDATLVDPGEPTVH